MNRCQLEKWNDGKMKKWKRKELYCSEEKEVSVIYEHTLEH